MSRYLYLAFIAAIAGQRLFELALSRRNAVRARERGAFEYGKEHFRLMALLHASFLLACPLEVFALHRPFIPVLGYPMLGVVVAAQVLRYWAIATLGERWNVRILVVPGLPAVTAGPYRWLRHPNYLAVILDIAAVPLVHTAFLTAFFFSLLNAWMLRVRIRCEERALGAHARYGELFSGRSRLLPTRAR